MLNLRGYIYSATASLILFGMIFVSNFVFASEGPKLPEHNDIFTIAFNVNGLKKESIDIYTKDELSQALSKANYLGRFHLQLRQPLSDHYWSQDGIVVLKDKTVFSFTVYRDMDDNQLIYINIYFGDGNGVFLYKLPK